MAEGSKPASSTPASGSGGAVAPQTNSLKSKGLGLLRKVKVSVELLIALAALLSWVVVGVVMFDFVEYKTVPDIQQIITDPMQAVNDAVDEVSSLLNKFQECAPDLSDPASTAAYVAEEISEAKDGFVRHFSDEDGNFYLSYVDPVVIGRRAFHSTNDFMGGMVGNVRDSLCAFVDTLLDIISGKSKGKIDLGYIDPVVTGRGVFSVINEFICGVEGYIKKVLCAVWDTILDVVKGTTDISFMDPVSVGRNVFSATNDTLSGIATYIQDVLCSIIDSTLDIVKGTTDITFVDPVVIGRNAFSFINDIVSGVAGYIQGALCTFMDVILDTLEDFQQAVGFSPMSVLKTTAEITKEQINMLVSYVSSMLLGDEGIVSEVSIDPMKVVEDAVLEFTDKKDLFVAYMSSMLVGDQDKREMTQVDHTVAEIMHAAKDEAAPAQLGGDSKTEEEEEEEEEEEAEVPTDAATETDVHEEEDDDGISHGLFK
nr:PREDICTED: uncharacterized protein LOC109636263 [Paralichthys olivaceus]